MPMLPAKPEVELKPGCCIGSYEASNVTCRKTCTISLMCRREKIQRMKEEEAFENGTAVDTNPLKKFLEAIESELVLEDEVDSERVTTHRYHYHGKRVCVVKVSKKSGRMQLGIAGSASFVTMEPFQSVSDAEKAAADIVIQVKKWYAENV